MSSKKDPNSHDRQTFGKSSESAQVGDPIKISPIAVIFVQIVSDDK